LEIFYTRQLDDFYFHHFIGTKNVIDACVELQIKRLIYTSSPSVVFDGVHGIINGDESLSYPVKVLILLV